MKNTKRRLAVSMLTVIAMIFTLMPVMSGAEETDPVPADNASVIPAEAAESVSTDTEQVEEETAAPEEVITKDISKEKTTAPEAAPKAAAKASAAAGINEDPNLFERLDGYGRESKFYNNTDYYEMYATLRAKEYPESGKKIWAINLDKNGIYGSSDTNVVKAYIYRDEFGAFDISGRNDRWMLVSAPDAQTAADIAGSNSSKATRISFKTYSDIGYNLAYRYDFATSSVGYDYFIAEVSRFRNGYDGKADGANVYFYKNKKEGELFQEFNFDSEITSGSFMLTGLKPGTTRQFTVHTYRIVDGLVYDYWDGTHWAVKTNTYNTPGLSVLKMSPNKVMLVIKVPYDQQYKNRSSYHIYRGSKKIKTLQSNGKARITYTYSAKKAINYKYKVKSVYNAKKSINKTTKLKKPISNTYKRQGSINPNIDAITPYMTARFVPWQLTYYNGQVKMTGYIVNNRMFTLKKYKFKVEAYNDGKKVASKTVTYKNIKKYAYKKVTITMKTKKAPDFVNKGAGWSVTNLVTKWPY